MPDSIVLPEQGRFVIHHGNDGWLRITGSEHKSWLQGITTADVANLEQGAFWGLFLDRTGKIRHEAIGIVEPNSVLLYSVSHGLAALHQYLDSLLVMEDVDLSTEPDTSLWSIHGVTGDEMFGQEKALAYGTMRWVSAADRVCALRVADEPAWLASLHGAGVVLANRSTWETLRIAAGVPRWGVDYTDQDTPHHAGLYGRAVAPDKGCYVGQEVVCKVAMRGHVAQRVARLALDSAEGVSAGIPVALKMSGEIVGNVTSISPSAVGNYVPALARVKTASLQQQSEFVIGTALATLSEEIPPA
jgi:folate-binding protein YgfZ